MMRGWARDSNGESCILFQVNPTSRAHRLIRTQIGVTLLALLAGCAPSATEGGFSNPAPGARVYAIEESVKFNRRSDIPSIVECLCSDDELVRFMAIGALKRMTEQDLDYRFDDPEPMRIAAYKRWQEWTIAEHLAPPMQAYSSTIYPPVRPRPQW